MYLVYNKQKSLSDWLGPLGPWFHVFSGSRCWKYKEIKERSNPGFKSATFQSQVQPSTDWAIRAAHEMCSVHSLLDERLRLKHYSYQLTKHFWGFSLKFYFVNYCSSQVCIKLTFSYICSHSVDFEFSFLTCFCLLQ